MKRIGFAAAGLALYGAVTLMGAQAQQVDSALPAYQKVSGVSGNVNSVGSDTMNNMMTLWAETFKKMYPNVKIQIEGKGSGTAPAALTAGTSQFGPMSREMRPAEIDAFELKYGYKPTQIKTSYDALAVYVNKDNPIEKATLAQIDGAFSKTRRRGGKNAGKWGDIGLSGDWSARPLSLYGRNSASGTYGFFRENVLSNGDYKDTVKEQPGSASVVQGVTEDRFGIGYSGIGYKTSGVKVVALEDKGATSSGSYADVVSGKYPLARFLYVYVNKGPGKPLDPVVREFLRFVFSKEGQEIVIKDGYYPLPAKVVQEELAKIQ